MKFGENLKKLRGSKNISQEELAEKVGVSRQSVSKWETGDAYPEMNNILQLCKIFKCEINTLVNDNMIDLDSLDEEIKMSVVKLKRDKQRKVKGLSKAIYIISRIGKFFIRIGIVMIAVAMLIVPAVGVNIRKSGNNSIKIFNKVVNYERDSEIIKIVTDYNTYKVTEKDKIEKLDVVLDYVEKNDLFMVSLLFFCALLFIEITLLLTYYVLKHLDDLFTNIYSGDTPFTMENVDHIKKMAYLMIGLIIFPSFINLPISAFVGKDVDFDFHGANLLYILILFSMSYIFEYGYQIQLDSNGKMYGDDDE